MAGKLFSIGEYSVKSEGADIKFWPVTPGMTAQEFLSSLDMTAFFAPMNLNTLAVPPHIGVFDILIELSQDGAAETAITEAEVNNTIAVRLAGKPSKYKVPLVREEDANLIRVSFAVPIPAGKEFFEGALTLHSKIKGTATKKTAELPLKVEKMKRASDMFIFFIIHKKPDAKYCWFKMKVVEKSAPATPISTAKVLGKVLRDQFQNGFKSINRRTQLQTASDGYVARDDDRKVIGMPIEWPLIFNVFKNGYVQRGHMIRWAAASIKHNLEPVETSNVRMMKIADVDLSDKKIVLDPGHGVVYKFAKARRSQEWFVAHKIADRVSELLRTTFGMPAANILFTRTAGFGLIDPGDVHVAKAPELGDARYRFDLLNRRVRVRLNALGLRDISDLVLTRHDYHNEDPEDVAAADRQRLLDINVATVSAIVARINTGLAPRRRVQPGSVRWDQTADAYVYTLERINPAPPQELIVNNAQPLPISPNDWFTLDDDMMDVLASRSAAWSIYCEVGKSDEQPNFRGAAQAAMQGAGALRYMRDSILRYLNVAAPHPYLSKGIKGWGPDERMEFMNDLHQNNPCDLYFTIHENAGGGIGGLTIVSGQGGASAPPDPQIRIGKIMTKYLDPFDQGTRSGGVTKEEPTNPVGMLHSGNDIRALYAYLELEFMDATVPGDASKFRYEQMVDSQFINTVADQLVAAGVEYLFDPQPDLDPVRYKNDLTLW